MFFVGVAQGILTGIRGLCNGLGPALYGFIFFLFHVDLNDDTTKPGNLTKNNTVSSSSYEFLHQLHEV